MAATATPVAPKAERVLVRVPFWAENAEALTAPLKATLNGSPVRVLRQLPSDSDLMLITVLDLAGDLSLVDPARQALIASLESLPARTQIALIRAQDGLRVLADPGTPRDKLAEEIRALPISGRSALLDTVETAMKLADGVLTKAFVRTAVLYLTDSTAGNYREDFTNPVVNSSDSRDMSRRFPEALIKEKLHQMNTRLIGRQTPLFIVHLNYQNDRINEAYQTGLLEMAAQSGGVAEFCRTQADIPAAVTRTIATLQAHHSVEIEFKTSKASEWNLALTSEGVALRHRTRFLAPRR